MLFKEKATLSRETRTLSAKTTTQWQGTRMWLEAIPIPLLGMLTQSKAIRIKSMVIATLFPRETVTLLPENKTL